MRRFERLYLDRAPINKLALVVEVKLEMLLNVNLARQLLLVLRLLGQLSHVVCFRGCIRVQGSIGCILGTWCRSCVRGIGRLHGEVGGVGRVAQGGAVAGSSRKGNNCRERRVKVLEQTSQ